MENSNNRSIKNAKGERLAYTVSEHLNNRYDAKYAGESTISVSVLCASSGNRDGQVRVGGGKRSYLGMALGRSDSNNAKITFHFSMQWIEQHENEFEETMGELAKCVQSRIGILQELLTDEQLNSGKEIAIISKALNDAKSTLESGTEVIIDSAWIATVQKFKAVASSTLAFKHSLRINSRLARLADGEDRNGFIAKDITDSNGNTIAMDTRTAQDQGIKSMPIFDEKGRDIMDDLIYKFGEVFLSELKAKGCDKEDWDYNEDTIVTVIKKAALDLIPSNPIALKEMAFSKSDLERIQDLTSEIIKFYREV